MYELKFTILQQEIFRLLCVKTGMSLNQSGIARLLKVSSTAVAKSLGKLEKAGLVKVKKGQGANFLSIELNRDNPKAIALKRVENLRQVYESGLAEYLGEKFPGSVIILFGSYSLGEDTLKSDIDIAIISSREKEVDLTKFDKMLERNAFLHFYDNLREIRKNLKENILNGITLNGAVEL